MDFWKVLRSARSLLVADEYDGRGFSWTPPPSVPAKSRWSCTVRNGFRAVRWCYCPFVYEERSWTRISEAEHRGLERFTITLSETLTQESEALWLDLRSDDRVTNFEQEGQCICCDFRLMNFEVEAFSQAAVLDAIRQLALESRRQIVAGLRGGSEKSSRSPAWTFPFQYQEAAGQTFGICWYRSTDFLSWPPGDNLRPVPRADLKETLKVTPEEGRPEVPELDMAFLPRRLPGSRGRPGLERKLDVDSFLAGLEKYREGTLDPIHDAVLDRIQSVLLDLAGKANPFLERNQALTAEISQLSRQYGFLTYVDVNGELVRMSVGAKASPNTASINAAAPSVLAGVFNITTYDDTGQRLGSTVSAALPEIIIGRDRLNATSRLARKHQLSQ